MLVVVVLVLGVPVTVVHVVVVVAVPDGSVPALLGVPVPIGGVLDRLVPAGSSFDVLLRGFVLFLLPDAPAAVRRWSRLSRPGRRLAIATFTEPTGHGRATQDRIGAALAPCPAPPAGPSDLPPPVQRLRTEESVTDLLTGNGFTALSSTERGYHLEFTGADRN